MAMASAFQRSPSKVWWAQGLEENSHNSDWHNRTGSGSPNSHKSQDSGFSDTETSPTLSGAVAVQAKNSPGRTQIEIEDADKQEIHHRLFSSNILKDENDSTPKKNFKENIKEKYTPKKSIIKQITEESLKKNGRLYEKRVQCCRSAPSTPRNQRRNIQIAKSTSETPSPIHSPYLQRHERLSLYTPLEHKLVTKREIQSEPKDSKPDKHTPKVSRNLMDSYPKDEIKNELPNINYNDNHVYSQSLDYPSNSSITYSNLNATVPLYYEYKFKENHMDDSEGIPSFSSSSSHHDTSDDSNNEAVSSDSFMYQNDDLSDCEKEVESFFIDKLEPPPHSSTPKVNQLKKFTSTPHRLQYSNHAENESAATKTANPKTEKQIPSVGCWLNEVESLYEPECMTTLQSKSIAMDLACHVSKLADEITAPIKEILKYSRIITKEFSQLKMHLQNRTFDYLGPLSQSLVGNITEFVLKFVVEYQTSNNKKMDHDFGVHKLLEIVKQLRKATMCSKPDLEDVNNLISNLQDVFYTSEYNLLLFHIQLLINSIEEPKSHLTLRATLSGITFLALQCERLSNLVVQTGGPRVLLILCVENKASTIRTMALRTLATVCCSTMAIRQLEKADGVDVLADILSDYNRPEPELSEATSVLAQITAPWIEDNHKVEGLIENIASLIKSITNFLEKTQCCQNLLLCAAALANLTYMNVNTIEALIKHNTIQKLLTAVRSRGPKASVFLKEQTATLIANLSDVPESRRHIADNNAAIALLCFLQITPIHPQEEAYCNSAQRLQQKSAIALSRLCSDVDVAKQIVELGGVVRLIQLCKDGRERNYSDAVLVACLATLRKIVANCGNDIMDQQDVIELVEPRLLDSFLAYSSQNESYV